MSAEIDLDLHVVLEADPLRLHHVVQVVAVFLDQLAAGKLRHHLLDPDDVDRGQRLDEVLLVAPIGAGAHAVRGAGDGSEAGHEYLLGCR